MPPLSPHLPAPDWAKWPDWADAWFHRSVTRFIREKQPETCSLFCENDPECIDAVADALLARRAEFVWWEDAPWCNPDDDGPEGWWRIDYEAVCRHLESVAFDCMQRLRLEREAEACPTLDDWLTALHRGEVGPGPEEKWAGRLVRGGRTAWIKARQHRRRPCKVCGRAFRPVDCRQGGPQQRRGNATRCPDCRGGTQRRTARKAGRR